MAALAAWSLPAAADIYVWRDRYGVSHYTNDLANIPAEYRESAYPVARDWSRPPPPPEPVEAPAEPTPTPQPEAALGAEREPPSGLFEAGYLAGLRAAEAAGATAIASATAVPLIVLAPEPRRPLFVHGLFPGGKPLPPLRRPDRERRREERPVPFQGPAGPPPLGAPGPPPFQPFSR